MIEKIINLEINNCNQCKYWDSIRVDSLGDRFDWICLKKEGKKIATLGPFDNAPKIPE